MRAFIQRYLDPVDRLGEILFGLIMALGFTGAVRLGHEKADNRELFIGIVGCNVAWAIVDGVMYVLGALFERGRKARLIRDVLMAPNEAAARQCVDDELGERLAPVTTLEERELIYGWVLAIVGRAQPEQPIVRREDVLGGVAVALVIVLATFPVVVPYLVVRNPSQAVRVSNVIALGLLFLLGVRWGGIVGAKPFHIGAGLTLVGIVLVLITIAFGG